MKLVKQITLTKGDAIYEVDLCDVGDGFVVNYRYGKVGGELKHGSKTVIAEPRQKAERIYDKLVQQKRDDGYLGPRQPGEEDKAAPSYVEARDKPPEPTADQKARGRIVLERLRTQVGPQTLTRAIWRAGEMRLSAATKILVKYTGKDAMTDYCVAWALGRCGGDGAAEALRKLGKHKANKVRRIATEALRMVDGGAYKQEVIDAAIASLPEPVQEALKDGSVKDVREALGKKRLPYVEALYLIDADNTRPIVLGFARKAKLQPPHFRRFRRLFKRAEYREDAELFGLCAFRFEKTRAMYTSPSWGNSIWRDGRYMKLDEEMKQKRPSVAYSSRTRAYFRRRVWRTLRRMGELGDLTYVKMAVGVLLPYSDGDGNQPRETHASYYSYNERRYISTVSHWGPFAGYMAFNHVLHTNSPRFERSPSGRMWRCREGVTGETAPPALVREEAFPALWDQMPIGLLHLMSDSEAAPVHDFAARAIRHNQAFTDQLDSDAIVMLLGKRFDATALLGLELAERRYDASSPDLALIMGVADCHLSEAQRMAQGWVDKDRSGFAQHGELVARFILSPQSATRKFAGEWLASVLLSAEQAQALIARIIAEVLTIDEALGAVVADAGDTLRRSFGAHLRNIGFDVLRDMIEHPVAEVQTLGGQLAADHERPDDVPEDLLVKLLNAEVEATRAAGMQLFSRLSPDKLHDKLNLWVSVCVSPNKDLRDSVSPWISKLAADNKSFAADLAGLLVMHLLRKETFEGVHLSLVAILRKDLKHALGDIGTPTVMRLLSASSSAAQELGGVLLVSNVDDKELDVEQMAKLASHEVLAVREAAWRFFESNVERLKENMGDAVRILDATWEDSRKMAFALFREKFSGDDFDADQLVAICDSVRPDVQRFGRELITRHFSESDGPQYMLKLSEHPAVSLQLFTTNYLKRYAGGSTERIAEMAPYFYSVLSRVNQGRVAKKRALAFLRDQALEREDLAIEVAQIVTRQSATMAIENRAEMIEIMVAIAHAYPTVALPIKIKPLEVRA